MSFVFGTKAQTLERLAPLVTSGTICPLLYFTVEDWSDAPDEWRQTIAQRFAGQPLAVRSSALREDEDHESMAGAFTSCLNVSDEEVPAAVARVIASYSGHPKDQILVQPMAQGIVVSGVMTTHVVDDGAPYYVLNYDDDSGKTDTVTGGIGVNKTVLISRRTAPSLLESDRVRRWLLVCQELEKLCGDVPLDVEFGEDRDGLVYIFQVRRIARARTWNSSVGKLVDDAQDRLAAFFQERSARRPGLAGARTILGEMPDWNPAEIIGTNPRPLAASLYRTLITDRTWRLARAAMGYRHPLHETLMVGLGGRPFIDVRNSFNSLLPAPLEDELAERIVDAWLDRLDRHPEFHDKVEFEVAVSARTFDFEREWGERYPELLAPGELDRFRELLTGLTRDVQRKQGPGGLAWALETGRRLVSRPPSRGASILSRLNLLIQECMEEGTLPFAVAARHAFIAESQLRSLLSRGVWDRDRLQEFKSSLNTVAGQLGRDLHDVLAGRGSREAFLARYGHLRPGTYDVLSLRYDQREDLFSDAYFPAAGESHQPFGLTSTERRSLDLLLAEAGLTLDADSWLDYCRLAIAGREEVKFHFSRHLSDVLELVVRFGAEHGLSREDVSYLEIGTLLERQHNPILSEPGAFFRNLAALGREQMQMTRALRMSYILRHERDLYVAPMHRSAPTFITNERVEARTVHLDARVAQPPDMYGAIVCIENADPGFDWIFTRGIAGLVTQFGGPNSHMAVRSAELKLPAAIGCGQQTFARVLEARLIELDCGAHMLRPIFE